VTWLTTRMARLWIKARDLSLSEREQREAERRERPEEELVG